MKTVRWLGAVLVAALGVAAAAFVGAVSPADAGEQAIPVRLDGVEQKLTIQGDAIESLRQQVITLSGQDFGALQARMGALEGKVGEHAARMDGLDKQVGDLKSQLAEARKENADLRSLLGAEAGRLGGRIDQVQASLNAKIDAVRAELDAKLAAVEARLQQAIADGDAALRAQLNAQKAELNGLQAQGSTLQGQLNSLSARVAALEAAG